MDGFTCVLELTEQVALGMSNKLAVCKLFYKIYLRRSGYHVLRCQD